MSSAGVDETIDLGSDSDEDGGPEPIDLEACILGPVVAAARRVKTEAAGVEPRGEQAAGRS